LIPETLFAELDRAIAGAAPEERPALVVQLAARVAALGAGLTVPVNEHKDAAEPRPGMLTYQEAARFLNCSPSYVETLVRQGKLPHVKLPASDKAGRSRDGRLVRLLMFDLRAFAAAHRN
jgi:helix-turn-helix protein